MTIRLDEHPDRGCWISDDRVNAFISEPAHGISEVGFHGLQPVSRNSRLLVLPEGVLGISVRTGREIIFPFTTVNWTARGAYTSVAEEGKEFRLAINASGRSLVLTLTAPPKSDAAVIIRFSLDSLFTGVHGERTWSEPVIRDQMLSLKCRDRIILREWLRRTGPYAGDFLIPEPWRRIIFSRRCRSGLATLDDLLPEYREADIALYDAETCVRLGGRQFTAVRDGSTVAFTAHLGRGDNDRAEFVLQCAEHPDLLDVPASIPPRDAGSSEEHKEPVPHTPGLDLPSHVHLKSFFATVPVIVHSCTVRDFGMTRATPGAYYWIWAWDNIVTALEMLRWNENAAAGRIVRFINSHRDADGAIPARWTHACQPLDTPQPGALEFLLLLLATQNALESGEINDLLGVYPYAASHLRRVALRSNAQGLMRTLGFYPDLPLQFGRSEQSAVAMETGATYAFCRLMEVVAHSVGDHAITGQAGELGARIAHSFAQTFWDEGRGFLRDSVNLETGAVNDSYPLFSLLLLQTPLGFALIRPFLGPMARFARSHFQTPDGTLLLPAWDARRGNEPALSSWYPHWDLYLLKLLRRAGERDGILAWLESTERVLGRLGYAPEFLTLEGFAPEDPAAWRRHGAVSNLNCATGWYRSIIEGLFGIEFDPGGMTVIPLDLPLGPMKLRQLVHRGSMWDVSVENGGRFLDLIRIDGRPLHGCTKIPSRYHDNASHQLEVTYAAREPGPLFTEIINAEVIESRGDHARSTVTVRALGTVDVAFPTSVPVQLTVDGTVVPFSDDLHTHTGFAQLPIEGTHELSLSRVV